MPVVVESEREPSVSRTLVARVRVAARQMLAALSLQDAELSIVLVDDDAIQALNREHRGIDEPTDVLAFPMDFADDTGEVTAPPEAGRLLGDVVISVPTASRQASAAGHPLDQEVIFLLAHGMLHLVGLDHAEAAGRSEMDRETARLVRAADPKK